MACIIVYNHREARDERNSSWKTSCIYQVLGIYSHSSRNTKIETQFSAYIYAHCVCRPKEPSQLRTWRREYAPNASLQLDNTGTCDAEPNVASDLQLNKSYPVLQRQTSLVSKGSCRFYTSCVQQHASVPSQCFKWAMTSRSREPIVADTHHLESIQPSHVPNGLINHAGRPFGACDLRSNTFSLISWKYQKSLNQITVNYTFDWSKVAAVCQVVAA